MQFFLLAIFFSYQTETWKKSFPPVKEMAQMESESGLEAILDFLIWSGCLNKRKKAKILYNDEGVYEESASLARFQEEARKGVVLAKLAQKFKPELVSNENRRISSQPNLAWQRRANCKLFLKACKKMGVGSTLTAEDIELGVNSHNLLESLRQFAKRVQKLQVKSLKMDKDNQGNYDVKVGMKENGQAAIKDLVEVLSIASN